MWRNWLRSYSRSRVFFLINKNIYACQANANRAYLVELNIATLWSELDSHAFKPKSGWSFKSLHRMEHGYHRNKSSFTRLLMKLLAKKLHVVVEWPESEQFSPKTNCFLGFWMFYWSLSTGFSDLSEFSFNMSWWKFLEHQMRQRFTV